MDIYEQITKMADEIAPELVAQRRDFHKFAEKGWFEMRTSSIIARKLTEMGYEVLVGDQVCKKDARMGVPSDEELEEQYERAVAQGADPEFVKYTKGGMTGVIGILRCGEGPTVAMRFDIDALGVFEEKDKSHRPACEGFGSVNEGFMHACGHDTHNAMLLGAVKVILKMRDEFAGTVRFLFQPGEETCEGAPAMIKQGALDGADYAFGIHISSTLPCGHIAAMPGASHAATDRYWITINGKTAHGADPKNGVDAAVAGAATVMALQTLVSREYDPADPLVVTVGQIHSGSRFNIIPGKCEIEGTVRTYSREIHDEIQDTLTRIAKNTAAAFRCTADVKYDKIAEVNYNDEEAYAIGVKAAEEVAPGKVEMGTPTMGGEDFSFYTSHTKCAFFSLGARWPDVSKIYSMHHESVLFDESALETGVAFYAQVAIDALDKMNSEK